jgi:hypothetical protein
MDTMKRLFLYTAMLIFPLMLVGAVRDVRRLDVAEQGKLGMTITELETAVALGLVPDAYIVNKFGYNGALTAAGTEESVWDVDDLPTTADGPVRCFGIGSTAVALNISSDDEADAAKTIMVEWLDATWALQLDEITLGADNGATGTEYVAIGTALRVNRAYATGAALVGNIYIHKDAVDQATKDGVPDTVATDNFAGITIGENQTLQACYTVPLGFVALMTSTCVSNLGVGTPAATFRTRISVDNAASRTQVKLSLADELTVCSDVRPPKLYREKTDIEITGDATTQSAGGTFGLIVLPEVYLTE